MASVIQVQNETNSQASRLTKEGKRITYALQVIQQPERARACGSGAKSSADRRPVDPPPIVELRVYEGEGPSRQEITFAYNANFFLFATLENARMIAPGRGQPTAAVFPVLTGTPVAGMAYLDRPSPAGYFIFPDLSVRHEGKYRLSFALYEELKDPKDMDPEDRASMASHTQSGIDAHVSHRLEVKSSPFTVFSAKKFPGLSESTALSRMVAEQGCRVRIRRDVRMRRRENKGSKDWDDYDEEPSYDQQRRTATPDTYNQPPPMPPANPAMDGSDRPRSVSNASNSSFAAPRRPSMEDMAQAYQSNNGYQPMAPPPSTNYSQMPPYASSQNQYQNQYAPPQPSPPVLQPPQNSYSHQSQPQAQPPHGNYQNQSGMHMGQSYGYMQHNQGYQQPHYEQPAPARPEPAAEYSHASNDYRRTSVTQPNPQQSASNQMLPPYSPMEQYNRPPQSTNSLPSMPFVPPLRIAPIASEKIEPVSPSYHSPPNIISAPMSATSNTSQNHGYIDRSLPKFSPQVQPPPAIGTKRTYSSTFDTSHVNERLQQGARPNPSGAAYGYDGTYDEADMEEPMDRSAMSYRRADGTQRSRRVPELGA